MSTQAKSVPVCWPYPSLQVSHSAQKRLRFLHMFLAIILRRGVGAVTYQRAERNYRAVNTGTLTFCTAAGTVCPWPKADTEWLLEAPERRLPSAF